MTVGDLLVCNFQVCSCHFTLGHMLYWTQMVIKTDGYLNNCVAEIVVIDFYFSLIHKHAMLG